jgi:hypothetical protein
VAATEAWQRSVLLARESTLDPALEPRLKRAEKLEEAPTANHPFFWAGYLLVDTGYDPAGVEDEKVDQEQPPTLKLRAVPPKPAGAKDGPPAEPRAVPAATGE